MNQRTANLADAFNAGWQAFTRNPWLALGGMLLFSVISWIGGAIPFFKYAFMIFVAFPLSGGFYIFTLNIVRDNNPQVGDLFAGFQRYWQWMGLGWLIYAIVIACMVPAAIIGAVLFPLMSKAKEAVMMGGRLPGGPPTEAFNIGLTAVMVALIIAGAIVAIVIVIRYIFAYYLLADGLGIMESLRMSVEMTKGQRLMIFLIVFVLGLFGLVGVIGCVIGVIFTSTITYLALAALYLQMLPEPPSVEEPPVQEA